MILVPKTMFLENPANCSKNQPFAGDFEIIPQKIGDTRLIQSEDFEQHLLEVHSKNQRQKKNIDQKRNNFQLRL